MWQNIHVHVHWGETSGNPLSHCPYTRHRVRRRRLLDFFWGGDRLLSSGLGTASWFRLDFFLSIFYSSLQLRQPTATLLTRTPVSAKVWTNFAVTMSCFVFTSCWQWGSWRPSSSTHPFVWWSLAILSPFASRSRLSLQLALQGIFFSWTNFFVD